MLNAVGTLLGIALNPWIALSSMDTLAVFGLPIPGHEMSFQLFASSSSISSIIVLQFPKQMSFAFLVVFILRYFSLLGTIVTEILFLISRSAVISV